MTPERIQKLRSHWVCERRLLDAEDERENGLHYEQARVRDIIADTEEALRDYLAIHEHCNGEDPIALIEAAMKLPITKDNKRVNPCTDSVWVKDEGYLQERAIIHRHNPRSPNKRKNGYWTRPQGMSEYTDLPVSECWSTPEAARAEQ